MYWFDYQQTSLITFCCIGNFNLSAFFQLSRWQQNYGILIKKAATFAKKALLKRGKNIMKSV